MLPKKELPKSVKDAAYLIRLLNGQMEVTLRRLQQDGVLASDGATALISANNRHQKAMLVVIRHLSQYDEVKRSLKAS